jgi:LPXTG-site transpeptidase (sortase) family protein
MELTGLAGLPLLWLSATISIGSSVCQPSHIDIPALNISVDVVPGYYNKLTESWSLSPVKAQFAIVSVPANNRAGDTYIYGHALPAVFGRLLNARTGDLAIVQTVNRHIFTYRMVGQYDIKPDDVSILNYRGAPIMTLQTCSGLWYQNRRVLIFSLESVT